jgi:hypothetical protein
VSDENCLPEDRCVIDDLFFNEGVCHPAEAIADGELPSDWLEECKAACDAFQDCGLPAANTATCRTNCEQLTEDQQRAIAGCGELECGDAATCLGVECLSADQCGAGEACEGGFCR